MKKNTKILIGVLALGGLAYLLIRNSKYAKFLEEKKSFAGEDDFFNANGVRLSARNRPTANQYCSTRGGLNSTKVGRDGKFYAICNDGSRTSNFRETTSYVYT
jgi:hypothetical protein